MNGAHALLATLRANGVNTIFANPGTTEIDLVAAMDDFDDLNSVLCLFEGVATGAADGFARVTGRPAATLVHLGPGFANGWANLHNARRARSPIINIVGDHPESHRLLDPPLNSDVEALIGSLGGWSGRFASVGDVGRLTCEALAAAYGPPGRAATLVLSSDIAWGEVIESGTPWPVARLATISPPDDTTVERTLTSLRTKRTALFVGGNAVAADQLELAQRVCATTSSRLIMETFPAIFDHGAGIVSPERLIYLSDFALAQLADLDAIVLIGTDPPVPPFAYRLGPDRIIAEGCEVIALAPPGIDTRSALETLVEATKAPPLVLLSGEPAVVPTGTLNSQSLAQAVAATMPEGLIISDESITGGLHLYGATQWSTPHRVMTLAGNAIGFGLPSALGAAQAKQGRVLAIEADGSMMYTLQALWTMAREGLDVTVVALSNRSYAVVDLELHRVHQPRDNATSQRLVDLDDPMMDLAGVAKSLGVPSVRATNAEELVVALRRSYATPGPMFIEAMLPKGLG
jgi:acetolactate synthase-1/2/3 large subunit